MPLELIIAAIVLSAFSGFPGLVFPRSSGVGEKLAAALVVAGSVLGLVGAGWALASGGGAATFFPWPAAGDSFVGVDALSAFFLVPVFLMGGLGSIYGLGYWPQRLHYSTGRRLRMFWGLLVAGPALLLISKHAIAFLLGWEAMALSAFFLVGTEDHREESRTASWVYLIATHVGTLSLFALFALWRLWTGSYALEPIAGLELPAITVLFLLVLVAFGLKAGMMPLHFWLPSAHANAPSHVSAMLSGIVLKMGIYGLVRFIALLPEPPVAWGGLILTLGAVSGLLGVVFAIGQHDLKRLLAYHSVENIGIILMGLGVALLGRSTGRPEWVVLGLAGCLLHVWNHALFKSLLFLAAGSVVHAAHTRQIDQLGGLGKLMPWTTAMFLVGAVAICGLPPLNGFVSELFVYLGLFAAVSDGAAVAAVPVLAIIGALALACFVKVFGAVFLGSARTRLARHAHESPLSMRVPMLVLAGCCVLIGLAPVFVAPVLDRVIAVVAGGGHASVRELVPLGTISVIAPIVAAAALALTYALALRAKAAHKAVTWDCGYARPTGRMQYTASSFAQKIVSMFAWVLRPRLHAPEVEGAFPQRTRMESHVDDPVLDRALVPAGYRIERWFAWFHRFQRGVTQQYLLYILITVVLMLGTLVPVDEVIAWLWAR